METLPGTFLTLETLRSLAGQAMVVMMATYVVRAAAPGLSTYWLRFTCASIAVALHGLLVWQAGMTAPFYALAVANGLLVALAAMRAAEALKGDAPPPPQGGNP